ncbi:hypothetical protein ORI20_10290 [Mycobacterium sp. CVI_P3]|uniref:Uncharacterized protein n=1 Tax=Mycobacterium pinniadriaticum TaxID=2994102 RepID=A0ABT3SC52_9MYCO|nr:hypothetical protein [Mycobacterium pinniadriaticum]MCX2930667.1 hypothetical protein [Mycobacterium pinniadriaticum]MCX2937091.1 hypothetical protein [Mycobacterium pinniadriaticum]
MTTAVQDTTGWGPLAHPVHTHVPAECGRGGNAPWRDNAFLAFWDTDSDVFGTVHVSTSPNAEGPASAVQHRCGRSRGTPR